MPTKRKQSSYVPQFILSIVSSFLYGHLNVSINAAYRYCLSGFGQGNVKIHCSDINIKVHFQQLYVLNNVDSLSCLPIIARVVHPFSILLAGGLETLRDAVVTGL